MKVVREDLDGTPIQRLVVTEPGTTEHFIDEVVGYLCPHCFQADETLTQIWHQADCRLAGEHGRQFYDDLEPVVDETTPTPELSPTHTITIVEYGETEGKSSETGEVGLHEGETVAFFCSCGNLDEDVFEIVHDESCQLAGWHRSAARRAD
ncbi:hypothetical protein J2752_000484 [Halarchaeum rubridurum]|uniref:Uncharacterized protein n=1 Tax=Halarchaeum rubridurum TaxID=489911 RepID=A0A830FZ28_9EURY|nr:hypothetical protein [Halarchaeum rubridurum]MBP1953603.1 hypothetical protein [Halarchaeum rubridurum]GGM64021.1 hypothetical protein GCM10009017_12600 [Halarchaeum rubridurum]